MYIFDKELADVAIYIFDKDLRDLLLASVLTSGPNKDTYRAWI